MISTTEILFRLALGTLYGGLIGYERQLHGRAAGLRTQMLVCISFVLIMIISEYYYIGTIYPSFIQIDSGRIAAGALTGIGFLGAGVIIKMGATVQGLTTAACLWMVSTIGLALGKGLYFVSTMALGFTLFTLIILRYVETKISKLLYKSLSVIAEEQFKEDDITSVLKKHNATIYTTDYEKDVSRKEIIYHYALSLKNTAPLSDIVGELSSKKGIKKVIIKSY